MLQFPARLQNNALFFVLKFTEGSFNGIRTNSGLLAADCYQVGLYSLKSSVYTRAIEWLEQSYQLTVTGNDTSINSNTVYDALQDAIKKVCAMIISSKLVWFDLMMVGDRSSIIRSHKMSSVLSFKPCGVSFGYICQHNKAIEKGDYNPYVYRTMVDPSLGDRSKRVRALAVNDKQYKLYFKDSSMMDFTNFAALCGGKKLRVCSK